MHIFSMSVRVDEAKRRLYFTCAGSLASPHFVDKQIAVYEAMKAPWLYDRVADSRNCQGFPGYGRALLKAGR